MPIFGDLVNQIQIAIASFWYNILLMLAGFQWSLLRGMLMMGYTIQLLTGWLASQAFSPLIQQTGDSLKVVTSWAFVVALFVLGITYMLASIVRLNVVSPRNAILWYIAGAIFFQIGPQLYQGMSDFRRTISSAFYLSVLQSMQTSAGQAFTSLNNVQTSELGILAPCDNFGAYLGRTGGTVTVSGLDVALAYLRADGIDVMGYPYPTASNCQPHTPPVSYSIPWEWYQPGSYFDSSKNPDHFHDMSSADRDKSIGLASASQWRLFSAWFLVWFAIFEQLVALCLTIAQGLTFVSFACAMLFAFFRRTEGIAWSIVDRMIETIVHTVIVAMMQGLVVSFFLAGAATNNGLVVMGIGLVCLILMLILLWSGLKAIWRSFNGLLDAMSKATGGTMVTVGEAVGTVAAGAAAISSSVALAGSTFGGSSTTPPEMPSPGGSQVLAGAARTLSPLPPVHDDADVLEGEFTPLSPARIGSFTPISAESALPAPGDIPSEVDLASERSAAEMQEMDRRMEQDLIPIIEGEPAPSAQPVVSVDAAVAKLENAADTLQRGAQHLTEGRTSANAANAPAAVVPVVTSDIAPGPSATVLNTGESLSGSEGLMGGER